MTSLFISVLNMSLMASFVALGVMLIRFPLKKAPKIFSYALWAIVLFKLLCPITIETPLSLNPIKTEPVPQNIIYSQNPFVDSGIPLVDNSLNQLIASALTPASPTTSANSLASNDPIASANPLADDSAMASGNPLENSNSLAVAISLQGTLFTLSHIWFVGLMLLLSYGIFSYFSFKHRLRVAIPLGKNVYETDRIKTAFVLGYLNPKIYLPLGLSERELIYILEHEKTHLKRKDHFIKLLAFIALCLHWFNPIVWLSYILAMRDMELSCDESVLRAYDSDIRKDYSNSLLELSVRQSGLVSPLSFGETGVKSRIKNVLNYKEPALWVSVVAIAVIILTAVLLLPNSSPGIGQNIGQETEDQSTEPGQELPAKVPENENTAQNGFAEITTDGKLRGDLFDLAIQYRFDYVPFFAEGYPPRSSAEYLFYAFAINSHNWGEDKGTMSKAYVGDVINKHFAVEDIIHEPLPKGWNFDDEYYTAVPQGIKDEPIYLLSSLKSSTKSGKTVYEAEMYYCSSATRYISSEEELIQIKNSIISGDYSLLNPLHKETFTYYLNDAGEPVFIAHIMTERPSLKWYYQMFRNDPGFMVLGNTSGEIDDSQMATYAILRMGVDYDYENGNSTEEYNAITQKYFGKNILNFNNGATQTISGSDRIRATGWSYNSSMHVLAKNIWDNDDGTITGDFYCINISDSYWSDMEGDLAEAFKKAEEDLLKGDISSFVEANCFITLKRVVFEVKDDEDGKPYFKYLSVKNLEDNVKSVILYSR